MHLLRKLCDLLSDHHGSIINYATLAKELKVSQPTIKKYVSYLEGIFMIRLVYPWHEGLTKLQVRSPKIYFRDSGILNTLLNLRTYESILDYAKELLLFEGFAIEEIIKMYKVDHYDYNFWSSYNRVQLELLIFHRGKKLGFNFSIDEKPKLTKGMNIIIKDLKLDSLTVIYPKGENYLLAENIEVISLEEYIKKIHQNGDYLGIWE